MSDPRQLRLFNPDDDAPAEVAVTITPAVPGAAVEKRCSKCGKVKAAALFNRKKSSRDGLFNYCRECHSAYDRARIAAYRSRGEVATPASKQCPSCLATKPAEDFRRNKCVRDGLQSECKACASKRALEYFRQHPEIRKAASQRRLAKGGKSAGTAVWRAVKKGDLARRPCEACGDTQSEGHHHSYEEQHRTDVVWLCRQCHLTYGHGGHFNNPPLSKEETRRLIDTHTAGSPRHAAGLLTPQQEITDDSNGCNQAAGKRSR